MRPERSRSKKGLTDRQALFVSLGQSRFTVIDFHAPIKPAITSCANAVIPLFVSPLDRKDRVLLIP